MGNKIEVFEPKFGRSEKFYVGDDYKNQLPTKKLFMLVLNSGFILCEKRTYNSKLGLRFHVINGDWYGRLKPDLNIWVEYTKCGYRDWKLVWECDRPPSFDYNDAINYVKRGLKYYGAN